MSLSAAISAPPDARTPEQIVLARMRDRIYRRAIATRIDRTCFSEVRRTLSEAGLQEQNSVAIALKQEGFLLAEAPTDPDEHRKWVNGPLARTLYRRLEPPSPKTSIRPMPVDTREPELVAA